MSKQTRVTLIPVPDWPMGPGTRPLYGGPFEDYSLTLRPIEEHFGSIMQATSSQPALLNVLTEWLGALAERSQFDAIRTEIERAVNRELALRPVVTVASVSALPDASLRLSQPLLVTVEQHSDGSCVAAYPEALVYGYGETVADALEDFKEQFTEDYLYLREASLKRGLGKALAAKLDVMSRLLNQEP